MWVLECISNPFSSRLVFGARDRKEKVRQLRVVEGHPPGPEDEQHDAAGPDVRGPSVVAVLSSSGKQGFFRTCARALFASERGGAVQEQPRGDKWVVEGRHAELNGEGTPRVHAPDTPEHFGGDVVWRAARGLQVVHLLRRRTRERE